MTSWTQDPGSGTAAGLIDHAAVPFDERAEPVVAHDFRNPNLD